MKINGNKIDYFYDVFGKSIVNIQWREDKTVEEILYNNGVDLFAIDTHEKIDDLVILICMSDTGLELFYPNAKKISNLEAYNMFGIEKMSDARERTYTYVRR